MAVSWAQQAPWRAVLTVTDEAYGWGEVLDMRAESQVLPCKTRQVLSVRSEVP